MSQRITEVYSLNGLCWLTTILGLWAGPGMAGHPIPHSVNLIQYVSLALRYSDSALNIQDDLYSRQLDVNLAATDFKTRLVPLANFRFGTGTGTQRVGMEARRSSGFGTTIATGVTSSQTTSDTFTIQNSFNSRAYVRLSQGLFRSWGTDYNRFGLTLAELKTHRQALEAQRERQNIILESAQKFYATLLSQQLIRKSQQALQRANTHLEAARSRQSVGLVSKVDVYRAELAKLTTKDSLMNQNLTQLRNREKLHELLAMPDTDTLYLDEQIIRMVPVIPESWEDNVLEYHSDWQTYLTDLEIANKTLQWAQLNTRPEVSLDLVLEQQGFGNSFGESVTLDRSDWSLQLQLHSTLELYEETANLERQRLHRARLLRHGQAEKRKIYRDVRQALDNLAAVDSRHRLNLERLSRAREALELSEIRYHRGLSTNLDVLDAEAAMSAAELDTLRAQVQYNIAAMRLGHALGILDIEWIRASLEPEAQIQDENAVD